MKDDFSRDFPLELPTSPNDPLLEGWYHTIEFGNGLISRGHFDHRSIVNCYGFPESLLGLRALDVATGDGFFAFELERRGAVVTAIDVPFLGNCDWLPRIRTKLPETLLASRAWGDRFKMAHALLASKVKRVELSVYDLGPERLGMFDVVFCGDLLLHLKNPLQALININSVTDGLAIIETVLEPALEQQFPNKPYLAFGVLEEESDPGENNTFWRFTSRALEDMMIYAGFCTVRRQKNFELPPSELPVTSLLGFTHTPDDDR